MEVTVKIFQKVSLSDENVKEVVREYLRTQLKIGLSGGDYPYIKGTSLMKYEDWGSRGSTVTAIRTATPEDRAIVRILGTLEKK